MVIPRRKSIIEQKADAFSDRIVLMYKHLINNNIENVIACQIQYQSMETDNVEVIKILTSIIKSKKKNMGLL